MVHTRPAYLLALFCLLVWGAGCGSGGGSSSVITNCSLATFTPNYAASVTSLLTWPSFPVRVFFIPDANLTANRKNSALAGFNQWVTATSSTITFQEVSSAPNADITVKFDPTTSNGLTELHFTGQQMQSADMTVGVRNLAESDIQCVAAHEFGHALGINGHSPDSGDLMYAVHIVGTSCPVTTRDLNTIKTGYCDLFMPRGVHVPSRNRGQVSTVRIQ